MKTKPKAAIEYAIRPTVVAQPEPPAASTMRRAATLGLLVVGLLVWIGLGDGRGMGVLRWSMVIGAAVVAWLPPVSTVIHIALARVRDPSPRTSEWAALLIGAGATAYFILTAFLQHRDLFPKTHDDCSYLIQMQVLARGRLWTPAHPLADFFDTFYVLVRPVYASQYFPGTALLYVPTVWLKLPTWLMPAMAGGAVVAFTYSIVTQLIDGAAGALAALWMMSLSWFRMLSILLYSQVPALLLGLLMVWAWLRWTKSRRTGWLLLIGAAAGWAAITRPVDALCFALPVGAAIAFDLWRQGGRGFARAGAILILGAGPFLVLQLTLNKGVTGHFFQTPFRLYLDRDMPNTAFGFPPYDPAARPLSTLPQKQEMYRDWAVPYIKRHQPGMLLEAWATRWLPMIVDTTMPVRLLLPLAVVGLVGLTDRRRWVLFATLPLFVGFYLCYTIFLEHYAVVVAPAVIVLGLLGIRAVGDVWTGYRGRIIAAGMSLLLAACVTSLWEVNRLVERDPRRQVSDETFVSPMLSIVNEKLPLAVQEPAVVLFRYAPGCKYTEEPVYNFDADDADDAPIIRAHDLGERNREIFSYYAQRQPNRTFYLYDEKTNEITLLGPATYLASK